MRRIISRTRTRRPPEDRDYNYDEFGRPRRRRPFPERRFDEDDFRQPPRDEASQPETGPKKKISKGGIIAIVAVFVVLIGGGIWCSSKSTQETQEAGPEPVVRQVIAALGENRLSTAKNYVASGDTTTSTKLTNLFNQYQDYFLYDEDYIGWQNMSYSVKSQSDTEAQVEVAGTAQIVEVDVETWIDDDGSEVEDRTETQVGEFDFANVVFGLKKVEGKWYLSQVPDKIF